MKVVKGSNLLSFCACMCGCVHVGVHLYCVYVAWEVPESMPEFLWIELAKHLRHKNKRRI